MHSNLEPSFVSRFKKKKIEQCEVSKASDFNGGDLKPSFHIPDDISLLLSQYLIACHSFRIEGKKGVAGANGNSSALPPKRVNFY